jgi:hypothetical protein
MDEGTARYGKDLPSTRLSLSSRGGQDLTRQALDAGAGRPGVQR